MCGRRRHGGGQQWRACDAQLVFWCECVAGVNSRLLIQFAGVAGASGGTGRPMDVVVQGAQAPPCRGQRGFRQAPVYTHARVSNLTLDPGPPRAFHPPSAFHLPSLTITQTAAHAFRNEQVGNSVCKRVHRIAASVAFASFVFAFAAAAAVSSAASSASAAATAARAAKRCCLFACTACQPTQTVTAARRAGTRQPCSNAYDAPRHQACASLPAWSSPPQPWSRGSSPPRPPPAAPAPPAASPAPPPPSS